MKPRTIVIKVDSLGERQPIFEKLRQVMQRRFRTLISAEYSDAPAFFGIWNTYFVVTAEEYRAENEQLLMADLRELYHREPEIANGYKLVWDGDRLLRQGEDAVAAGRRFSEDGSVQVPLGPSGVKPDGELSITGLVEMVASGSFSRSGTRSVESATCYRCRKALSSVDYDPRALAAMTGLVDAGRGDEAFELLLTFGGRCG